MRDELLVQIVKAERILDKWYNLQVPLRSHLAFFGQIVL